jgi:hydroxyacylglutathione hydrolase
MSEAETYERPDMAGRYYTKTPRGSALRPARFSARLGGMRVVPVPCLQDNYAYLLAGGSSTCVVVDPSEAEPVLAALEREGLTLGAIWLTHHHHDHVGGIEDLCDRLGQVPVLGSAYDQQAGRIPRQTQGLTEADTLSFEGAEVRILEIPGHTLGAIAYLVSGYLFSGDTLFCGGCGRVFEGTMPMMQESLAKLRALPIDTKVYPGHEYTLSNLRFAASIEPENRVVQDRKRWAELKREKNEPTVPGTLTAERLSNVFLRWDVLEVQEAAKTLGAASASPADVFGALRKAKDGF